MSSIKIRKEVIISVLCEGSTKNLRYVPKIVTGANEDGGEVRIRLLYFRLAIERN